MFDLGRVPRPVRVVSVAIATLLVVSACGASGSPASSGSSGTDASTAGFPVKVHAANGDVTVPSRPTSIVSLSPTATEMLYAVGAGDQVVAVDDQSDYPKNAPTTKLSGYKTNVEAVAKYHPDLVVTSNFTPALAKKFDALGIKVLSVPAASNLDDSYRQLRQLGRATGHSRAAKAQVATMKRKIARIVDSTGDSGHDRTYYYELTNGYYSVTSQTFVGQVLGLLGLRSIADAVHGEEANDGYPQLSAEVVLKKDPDYVFLADVECCGQSAESAAARPGWSTLDAVRGDRVIELDDDIASRWGPRIVVLLQKVSKALKRHPVSPGR